MQACIQGLQRHQGVVPQGSFLFTQDVFCLRLNNQNLCNGSWPQEEAQVEFPKRVSNGHVTKSGCLKDYAS